MSEQQRKWHPGQEESQGYSSKQMGQSNAFGQPQQNRYQANDERPYQTGNVSWEGSPSHRGKGPKGYKRSDDRIRDDVHHRLTEDDLVDATEIEVQVMNAEVTLNGTVPDRDARRRAEDLIDSISGVNNVQNNLRVKKENSNTQGPERDRQTDRNSSGAAGERSI